MRKRGGETVKEIKGRLISKGDAEAEVIISRKNFSFLGDVDIETGEIVAKDSDIRGQSISNKIFIFPYGRGSTVGTYSILAMEKKGTAPSAIINKETDAIIAVGAIISSLPLIDRLEKDPFKLFKNGDKIKIKNGKVFYD